MKKILLCALPGVDLVDSNGKHYNMVRTSEPLGGLQILAASLSSEFDVTIIDTRGEERWKFGTTNWEGIRIDKLACGKKPEEIDISSFDVIGISINFQYQEELAKIFIQHFSKEKPVVVGGSQVIATKGRPYFEAGASLAVLDKTGTANVNAIKYACGLLNESELQGVILPDGTEKKTTKVLHPNDWILPTDEIAASCAGSQLWETPFGDVLESIRPHGTACFDMGCRWKCNFCETWLYRLIAAQKGIQLPVYQYMSPERAHEWIKLQKKVANSVLFYSDAFLNRISFDGDRGRDEAMTIFELLRKERLPFGTPNGLQTSEFTMGRGLKPDYRLDYELIKAAYGWDERSKSGCFQAYIPAERPQNPIEYGKLLPQEHHEEVMYAIAAAGVRAITYGVIIGLPDDDDKTLERVLKYTCRVKDLCLQANPKLRFTMSPFGIHDIDITPNGKMLQARDFLQYNDTTIRGSTLTPACRTKHMSPQRVLYWIEEITKAAKTKNWLILES